jgi:hypothetical protein
MSHYFGTEGEGWTTLANGHAVVELTKGELLAVFSALDSYLNAGTVEECRVIFGSHAGTRAASRAQEKVVGVAVKLGALKR